MKLSKKQEIKEESYSTKFGRKYFQEGIKQGRLEALKELIIKLSPPKTGCPYCAFILKDAHFCRRCNERVAVEMDYDGLIEELKQEIAKELQNKIALENKK